MTLDDLFLLLRQDLRQTFRFTGAKGKRTKRESIFKRLLPVFGVIALGIIIVVTIVFITSLIGWSMIASVITENLAIGTTLFNAVLLFSFIGSIMISANTVGNSKRMEYLMTMPIPLRTLFLEKTLIVILYSSILWVVIGVPIFIGLSIVSPLPLAFFSVIVFFILIEVIVAIGVAFGGLLGLVFARIVAGRRHLKQVGYFAMSSIAILFSVVWYYSIFFSDEGAFIFEFLLDIAQQFGLSSAFTPGYPLSVISLGLLVGSVFRFAEIVTAFVYALLALSLVYVNAVVSEKAHYSGWLASGSKRSSKKETVVEHEPWDPHPIPGLRFNPIISVSIWYNITNIRRESRVFSRYLMGPLQFVVFFFIPALGGGAQFGFMAPFLVVAALIPFSTAYGLYFAGYETVYEGKNLMNLQLAATNLSDYVKGKVYSAVPFTLAVSVIVGVVILLVWPNLWYYIPLVTASAAFTNLMAGAIAANVAASSGDFKAERMVLRQRGSGVQMPIRGLGAMVKAQLLPNAIGYMGVFSMIGLGFVFGPIFAYIGLPIYGIMCIKLTNKYSYAAGISLAKKEASEYL